MFRLRKQINLSIIIGTLSCFTSGSLELYISPNNEGLIIAFPLLLSCIGFYMCSKKLEKNMNKDFDILPVTIPLEETDELLKEDLTELV